MSEAQTEAEHEAEAIGHTHYGQRAPALRAIVLGATDGIVSVGSLLFGLSGQDHRFYVLGGVSALVGGALSMAVGEYISVSSSLDAELVDIEKEKDEQLKGPEARQRELQELVAVFAEKGIDTELAQQVAEQLTERDVAAAHAFFEHGLKPGSASNPIQAALASCGSFLVGAGLPLLSSVFVDDFRTRIGALVISCMGGLAAFGFAGAHMGDANRLKGTLRVLIGGGASLLATYGVGKAFG